MRSVVTYVGLGANIPSMSMYFLIYRSGQSRLTSSSTYTITLPPGWTKQERRKDEWGCTNGRRGGPYNTPGFWSVTAYDFTGHLLDTAKTSIHFPNANLVTNAKGETVIWLSSNPAEDEVNWLQLPNSEDGIPIYLIFRIYGAKERVVQQKCHRVLWTPCINFNIPPVAQVP